MNEFRLMCTDWTSELVYEDGPGSTCDVNHQKARPYQLWFGCSDKAPDRDFFAELGIEMPSHDAEGEDESKGLPIGTTEYSYEVEELVDGRWQFRANV